MQVGSVTTDPSQIRRTGTDSLEFPGTPNAFQVLRDLSRTLRNESGLQSTELASSLDRQLGELEVLSEKAYAVLGDDGNAVRHLRETARIDAGYLRNLLDDADLDPIRGSEAFQSLVKELAN